MPIQAASGLASTIRAVILAGTDYYADPNRTDRLGSFSSDADVLFVGSPIGETSAAYAVVVNTSSAYNDGVVRPTVVYVAASEADTYSVPPPTPPGNGDTDAAILARDAEWRDWLLAGSPTLPATDI